MPRQGEICQYFNRTLLKHYRKRKYKTRKAFASDIGVSERTAQAWELGEKKPSLRNLNKIANALEIDLEDILNQTGKQIWQLWQGHLLDHVIAGPEEVKKTKVEIREGSALTGYDSNSTTITKRELKLTTKEAIELTEKLGIFDDVVDKPEDADAETYDPLSDLVEGDDDE